MISIELFHNRQHLSRNGHFCILMLLSACSTTQNKAPESTKPFKSATSSAVTIVSNTGQLSCYPAIKALDKLVFKQSGTLSGNRIPTMPWLRHNRLITQDIRTQSTADGVSKLLQRMSALAIQGLSYELAIVPSKQKQSWQLRYQTQLAPIDFVKHCSIQLIRHQLQTPKSTLERLKTIPEDNDYSKLARVAGLYPLATIPFRLGVMKEQRQLTREWGQIGGKRWVKYRPDLVLDTQPDQESWRLLKRHAPTWYIDSAASANLPGAPFWQGEQLKVNTQQATTYAFVSEARWKQQPVTQLNYVIWFNERPHLKRIDLVAGQHDAVVFRVNLNQKGEVIAYDSIHLCGCWYRLFLPEGRPFKKLNRYWEEPVLMQRVRLSGESSPSMAVYLQADTHHIQYLHPATEGANEAQSVTKPMSYQLQPFSKLLQLPTADGVRSVFNPSGYVAGSERPERWLFWPMGVRNAGALRRFGDHAISFVGRRYFDEPHLLEEVSGVR